MEKEQLFMLLFWYTPNPNYQPTEQEQAQMKSQWGAFIGQLAAKNKLISTHQLGFTAQQLSNDLSITEGIRLREQQTLGGNMIVRATSIQEASTMAEDCPILKMGGSVEIRNILPMNQ